MKSVARDQHILRALQNAKCNLHKAILKNCDDRVIHTLTEIVHNIINGNVDIDPKLFNKLKRYKSRLRKFHQSIKKNTSVKHRRKQFVNQSGGFLPLLLGAVLSGVASYGGEKLAEYVASKFKK